MENKHEHPAHLNFKKFASLIIFLKLLPSCAVNWRESKERVLNFSVIIKNFK